jgi:hypothetical protein
MRRFGFGMVFGIVGLAVGARIRLEKMKRKQQTSMTTLQYLMETDPQFRLKVELTTWMMNAPEAGFTTDQICDYYIKQRRYIDALAVIDTVEVAE